MLSSATWGEQGLYSDVEVVFSAPRGGRERRDRLEKVISQARQVHRSAGHVDALNLLKQGSVQPQYYKWNKAQPIRPLSTLGLPQVCRPEGGHVPASRVERKEEQVANMIHLCWHIVSYMLHSTAEAFDSIEIVEFCAGSGFVGLPLAHMAHHFLQQGERDPPMSADGGKQERKRKTCRVTLVDWKGPSIDIAHQRVEASGLQNVRVMEMDQTDFREPFHLGLSLHACGGATDIGLRKSVQCGAAFVVCPCCLGKILSQRSIPLSQTFRSVFCPPTPYAAECVHNLVDKQRQHMKSLFSFLVKAGDFGHGSEQSKKGHGDERGRRLAKTFVEEDRRQWAAENDYTAGLLLMEPPTASAKHDLIFGSPLQGPFAHLEWTGEDGLLEDQSDAGGD